MENDTPRHWTIISDPLTCESISAFLKNAGLALEITLESDKNITERLIARNGDKTVTLDLPLKIGGLFDTLVAAQKTSDHASKNREWTHPAFTLDALRGTILLTGMEDEKTEIKLTEKENAILSYLFENAGRTVSRKELLTAVWEYAEGVETHTLETHIYRLRQKIEKTPSEPEILLTSENGYILKQA